MYPTLETQRLLFRPWQPGDETRLMDFAEVLNATVPDDELPPIHSLADAKWIVEDNIRDNNQWALVYKPEGLLIGWFGIGGDKRRIREQAVFWIWLDEAYWNRELCTEALQKALHFAFFGLKTKLVLANCKTQNIAACRTLTQCGFEKHRTGKAAAQFRLPIEVYTPPASLADETYDYEPPPEPPQSPYSFDRPIRQITSISYIQQPTEYLCGQSVIAMLAGVSVEEVIGVIQNDKGMDVPEVQEALAWYGMRTATKARKKYSKLLTGKLPDCCILSVQLPDYGHWSLYCKGKYYDPEFGVLDELPPQAKLVSYWEVLA